jgi:hypothetical protein
MKSALAALLLPGAVACAVAAAPEAPADAWLRPSQAADPARSGPVSSLAVARTPTSQAPAGANVHLTVIGDLPKPATLTVLHVAPAALAMEGSFGYSEDSIVLQVELAAVPTAYYLTLPPGTWALMGYLAGGVAEPALAAGYACKDQALDLVAIQAGPQIMHDMTLRLSEALFERGSRTHVCRRARPLDAANLFAEVTAVTTPPTKAGSAHFMAGHVWQNRLWIAGSQDGYVSFDFPAQPVGNQMQNWTVWGDNTCNRLERVGSTLFCASRNGFVLVLQTDPATQQKVAMHQVWLGEKLCTEGLAAHGSRLHVAVHGKGLRALDTKPPYAVLPVTTPPAVEDAWDLEPLDANHLALADGAGGLKILSVAGNKAAEPSVVAHLPLPGRSAFLHEQQGRLVVGALGGGLHLVDVAQPAAPKLQGTLTLPNAVYGVTVHLDTIFAAAGHHLVAVDLPPPGKPLAPLQPRAAIASRYFALDVDPFGAGLLSAEFRQVRRFDLDLEFNAGPVMLAPTAVFGRVAAEGAPLKTTLRLHNVGAAPLELKNLRVLDPAGNQGVPGQWSVPPGHSVAIPVAVKKVGKGAANHTVRWSTNDPAQREAHAPFGETTWLQPGDTLPAGLQWHDAAGQNFVVADHFKGKVGVLLIAADSCPVAFLALAAAAQDLQPWLAGGKAGAQVAALAVNPWDKPGVNPEVQVLPLPFPMLYSGLTTNDGHDWSDVLDVTLGQPIPWGPPMPIAYVVGVDGVIRHAAWGWDSGLIHEAIQAAVPK